MKRLLNTLYVTTEGAYLSRKGEAVLVRVENVTKLHIPVHTLDGIVCFGSVMCSPAVLGLCAERNVTVSFLSMNGRFLARVQGPVSGNVLLRRAQYRLADDPTRSSEIARACVMAKIANSRTVLMRATRERSDRSDTKPLQKASDQMGRLLRELRQPADVDSIRGKEGMAARAYFYSFDHLITAQKEHFFLRERNRRPPLDNMNALLSFLYTILVHDVRSALETVGLDPVVGFLHRDRPGRPGLALDVMEEFRPYLADRVALSLVNRRQISDSGFTRTESGAVSMDDKTRKTLLVTYQKRKQETLRHPFLGEKIPVGLLPHVQAMLLARYVRGEMDGYPAFLWK